MREIKMPPNTVLEPRRLTLSVPHSRARTLGGVAELWRWAASHAMRVFLTIVLIALSVIRHGRAEPPQRLKLPDRYFVAEAALRYMFYQHSHNGDERDGRICYVIKRGEFTEPLVASFAGYKPTVTATTNLQVSKDTGLATDKATGKAAKLWTVEVRDMRGDSAIAYVSWYSSRHAAGGHTIYLRRKDGRWVVESERQDWVS